MYPGQERKNYQKHDIVDYYLSQKMNDGQAEEPHGCSVFSEHAFYCK